MSILKFQIKIQSRVPMKSMKSMSAKQYNNYRHQHQMDDENSQKRHEFRVQIRRKQIDDLFASKRSKLIEEHILMEHQEIKNLLSTSQKRHQWVNTIAVQLLGYPAPEWSPIFHKISLSVRSFDEDFSLWISTGIIRALTASLKQQNLELKLSKVGASILADIFYQLPEESEQINQILEEQFLRDVIQLLYLKEDVSEYYQLITTMIDKRFSLRDKFINNGVVQVLSNRLKEYEDLQCDQVFIAMGLAYRLVKVYQDGTKSIQYTPKGNVISIFISIFSFYLLNSHRDDTIALLLKSLYHMVTLRKQGIYSTIMALPDLVNKLLQLMNFASPHKENAGNVIYGLLLSNKQEYTMELIHKGLLDIMMQYVKHVDEMNKSRSQNYAHVLLKILSNATATNNEAIEVIVKHEIFGHFIKPCMYPHDSNNKKIREEAFYIIETITMNYSIKYSLIEMLLNKYNILEPLCLELQSPMTVEILNIDLNILIRLIKYYQNVFTGEMNKVVDMLERFYNVSRLLLKLEGEIENKKVFKKISRIFSLINGAED